MSGQVAGPNDLSENTTPVSTRALLLVLENIENNADLDYKPTNWNKPKGAKGKHKMESIDSWIPKKPKKVGWTDKHCVLCKKHVGTFKSHNTCNCGRFNKDSTPIKNRGGASRPQPNKKGPEGAKFFAIAAQQNQGGPMQTYAQGQETWQT